MKASESFYMNGKLHGRSRTWHKSTGKKASEAFFHLGQTHGPAHKWYSNGKKESRNIYYYNMYDKLQYYWYPNGKIKKLLNYSRGRLCGAELYFDKSGARTRKVPRGSCSYKNHRETGFANLYGKVLIPNDNHQRYLDRLLDKKAINARYCLEKSLSKKFMFTVPIKKGKIVFEVTLSRRGRINHVKINAKSGRKKVQSCLVRIMKRWRFFRSKKQAKVKIIFHFAIF
jgi:antitoxin component YwqK of YwqJK toxin-antitoxin module